jgi:hypothetical protein
VGSQVLPKFAPTQPVVEDQPCPAGHRQHWPPTLFTHELLPGVTHWPLRFAASPLVQTVHFPDWQELQLALIEEQAWQVPLFGPYPAAHPVQAPLEQAVQFGSIDEQSWHLPPFGP